MMKLFYVFVLSLITTFFILPLVMKVAVRLNLVDKPGVRKVHQQEIPRIGGLAILISFIFVSLIFYTQSDVIRGILVGGIIVSFVGLLDDYSSISPYTKFTGQIVAAVVAMVISGLTINSIDFFGLFKLQLGYFSFPITVLWIVGITNAINLIDGLDGLAAGISTIIFLFMALIGYNQNSYPLMFISITMMGACLGFLKYNSHPAQVFLGDVGSLLLGFVLSMISLLGSFKVAAVMTLALPLTILGLPILDTVWAFTRRIIAGKSPFSPDRSHIHHRLMDLGLGHGFTVLFMYGITIFLGLIALLTVYQYEVKDYSLIIILLLMLYSGIKLVGFVRQQPILKNIVKKNIEFPKSLTTLRNRVSSALPLIIRNLMLAAMLINIVILSNTSIELIGMGVVLFVGLSYLYFSRNKDVYEQFLMFVLYFCGVYIIYVAEQIIDPIYWGQISAEIFSNILFATIGGLILINILFKQLKGNFLSHPFEFFILIFVLSMNLLPSKMVMQYHLAAVSIKSIIFFLGYRLLLEYNIERSRRLVYATLLVLGFIIIYSLVV